MASGTRNSKQRVSRRHAVAIALALVGTLASASAASAGRELALRFFDDNRAAQGPALAPAAQAEVERAAGMALIAKGRDADGAFRFAFALPPSAEDARSAVNKLRASGALVYAELVDDPATVLAKRGAEFAGDERITSLIVKLRTGAKAAGVPLPAASRTRLAEKAGAPVVGARLLSDGSQLLELAVPVSRAEAQAMLQRLAADSEVAHVEIDRRAKTQALPSDPMFASQWNLSDPTGGINAPGAWDFATGDPSVPIALLDTGLLPHPELAGRVVGGWDFVADVNFSNDGDGRDPDPYDPGDFVTSAESTTPGSPLLNCAAANSSWHGTMVGGTLAAVANNGSGVSGVTWRSPLLNVRVMGKCGGALSDVADGIRWSVGLPVPGVPQNRTPARVINLSLAGPGACGAILQSAITDALARGAVLIAAAGNNNADVTDSWPANCNGVIAVSATSKNGSRAFYSNSGARIAVAAPGGGIGGSIPTLRNSGTTVPDPNGHIYGMQLGSSLAAPHVAGIASLALALDADLTAAEVQALIETTARPFPVVTSDPCSTAICGAGIVDGAAALAKLAPAGGTTPPPPASTPPPTPQPTPVPTPPPATTTPPPTPVPMANGWRAKTPAELERLLKSDAPRTTPARSTATHGRVPQR